jgi:lysophospholipase L1-like esterase
VTRVILESMRSPTALRAAALVGTLIASVALPATTASAARPRPTAAQYVALGDSYAAGDGAGSYLSDGTTCYRSLSGYPGLIAKSNGYALNFQACSGATVGDVSATQLGTLSSKTAKVTITVGGNDIGFASTLSTCLGSDTTACLNAVAVANTKITTELPSSLGTLFAAIKAKAPNATIVATTYPRLFNGTDCSWLTSFTSAEMVALNAGADTLATTILAAAQTAGIRGVDVRTPFDGHAVCDSSAWIHNASLFAQYESFHPNSSGYLYGYKPSVASGLTATAAASGGAMTVTTGGQTSSDTNRGKVAIPRG